MLELFNFVSHIDKVLIRFSVTNFQLQMVLCICSCSCVCLFYLIRLDFLVLKYIKYNYKYVHIKLNKPARFSFINIVIIKIRYKPEKKSRYFSLFVCSFACVRLTENVCCFYTVTFLIIKFDIRYVICKQVAVNTRYKCRRNEVHEHFYK